MGLKIASAPKPETTPQRLSLCMIMKNEEEHLPRCLESVQGVVDEIVVVDTGSTDRSVEIAESFGATVLHEEWKGDFARPRNTSIDAATGDWILILDADEELVDGKRLTPLLQDKDIEGYSLREVNFIGDEVGIESVVNSAFRLFRNRPAYRYEGALHEQIQGVVDPTNTKSRFVGVEINHYGYLDKTSEARKKTDRNMAIIMDEVKKKPKDSFTLFNAGVEFQRIEDHETALTYFRKSFATLPNLSAYYASLLLRNIIASLKYLKRYDEALSVLGDALQAYPDFPDLHYLQGQIHAERREFRAAIRGFRRAIELGDHGGDRYLAQAGMGSFYSWYALGSLHEQMGDTQEAVRAFRRSIATAPGFYGAPLVRLTRLFLRTDDPAEVEKYLLTIIGDRRRVDSLRVIAAMFLEANHVDQALALLEKARQISPDDAGIHVVAADCRLRLGKFEEALAELDRVPAGSTLYAQAAGKRLLAGLGMGDEAISREAISRVTDAGAGLYSKAWEIALAACVPGADVPELPTGDLRPQTLEVLIDVMAGLLNINAFDALNRVTPVLYALTDSTPELDERLGLLLFQHDFADPAAEKLMAAVQAESASPEAYAALGEICRSKGFDDEAEAFMRAALENDDQNLSRYLKLATHIAASGRYLDANEVLRRGLLVYPHSTVLREIRQSFSLLAGAAR
jgi:tetratricopeptide (TPR) repeat protein